MHQDSDTKNSMEDDGIVGETGEAVKDGVEDLGEDIRDGAEDAGDAVRDNADQAADDSAVR